MVVCQKSLISLAMLSICLAVSEAFFLNWGSSSESQTAQPPYQYVVQQRFLQPYPIQPSAAYAVSQGSAYSVSPPVYSVPPSAAYSVSQGSAYSSALAQAQKQHSAYLVSQGQAQNTEVQSAPLRVHSSTPFQIPIPNQYQNVQWVPCLCPIDQDDIEKFNDNNVYATSTNKVAEN